MSGIFEANEGYGVYEYGDAYGEADAAGLGAAPSSAYTGRGYTGREHGYVSRDLISRAGNGRRGYVSRHQPGYGDDGFGLAANPIGWRCPPGSAEVYPGSGSFSGGSCLSPGGLVLPVQLCPDGWTQTLPGMCTEGLPSQLPPPPAGSTPCPPGQVGFPSLGLPCAPIPGVTQSSPPMIPPGCPEGQVGWPGILPCTTIAGLPPIPGTPPPQAAPMCPPGQLGWPPTIPCMMIPATPPGVPPTIVVPPIPTPPPAQPPPTAAPPAAPPVAKAGLPSWALPVGIGVVALGATVLLLGGKKKATPNRRRRAA